jgi:hypothetical protein
MDDESLKLLMASYGYDDFWCPQCHNAIRAIHVGSKPYEIVIEDDQARPEKICYNCGKGKK